MVAYIQFVTLSWIITVHNTDKYTYGTYEAIVSYIFAIGPNIFIKLNNMCMKYIKKRVRVCGRIENVQIRSVFL